MNRVRDVVNGINVWTATRCPELYVTQVHFLLLTVTLVFPIVLTIPIVLIRSNFAPNLVGWDLTAIVICFVIGVLWLALRARAFQTIPITSGLGRGHFIWLDFLGFFCIAAIVPSLHYTVMHQMRTVSSRESVEEVGALLKETSVFYSEPKTDQYFLVYASVRNIPKTGDGDSAPQQTDSWREIPVITNRRLQVPCEHYISLHRGSYNYSGSATVRAPTSDEFAAVMTLLAPYCSKAIFEPGSQSALPAEIVERASANVENLRIGYEINTVFYKQYLTGWLALCGMSLVASLFVAALPAFGSAPVDDVTDAIVISIAWSAASIVAAGVGIFGRVSLEHWNDLVYVWIVAAIGVNALIAVSGIFIRGIRTASGAAFFTCLLLVPFIPSAIAFNADGFGSTGSDPTAFLIAAAVMLVIIVVSPLSQIPFNKLHASPK